MTKTLKVLMAQIAPKVGALKANAALIAKTIQEQQTRHDLIVFPELALSGYPPEDLLLRPAFIEESEALLAEIASLVQEAYVVIGHPSSHAGKRFNSASVFHQQKRIALYHKQILPNYGVFDEMRYFNPGPSLPCIFNVKGHKTGICICEDIWVEGPVDAILAAKADLLIAINASPFEQNKHHKRETLLQNYAQSGISIVYVNQVGGQDELLFDGQSLAFNSKGELKARASAFQEHLESITLSKTDIQGHIAPLPKPEKEALLYAALVKALQDYVEKNHFPGVLLGLSGGIDSALTFAIAVDALGASRVHPVMMPSRFTSEISGIDALAQIQALGSDHAIVPIEESFSLLLKTLAPFFADKKPDTTEENIQARIRGLILMALANKSGNLLLTTSNKSETAVGYATLYGDMAGGFAPLKDVLKTEVYALAHYRNALDPIIPERVLARPPSAELAENQKDQDSLPDYPTLDAILYWHMEHNCEEASIIEKGFSAKDVHKVLALIRKNEHKRYQGAPGPKVSARAFGKDWRFPISEGD